MSTTVSPTQRSHSSWKMCEVCQRRCRGPPGSSESDGGYAPIQGSNGKRTMSQEPEALHTATSTKRGNKSGNLGIILMNNEDSDASSASVSRIRPQRSPVIKAETAFASQLNTRISGPLDDGVRDFDILEDGDKGQSPSSLNENLLKAATEFPYHRGPRLGASNHDYNHGQINQLQ